MSLQVTNAVRISNHFRGSPHQDFYASVCEGSLKKALIFLQRSYDASTSTSFMRYLFKCVAENELENTLAKEFDVLPKLVDRLLELGADPNVSFPDLSIGFYCYLNPTCWHVAYLYFEYLGFMGTAEEVHVMRTVFCSMLNVFGLNLRAKFSENDGDGHFSDDRKGGGEYLEEITLAQYALAIGDFDTLQVLLDKDPSLVNETCLMTTAKGLLSDEYCWNDTVFNKETSSWERRIKDFEPVRKSTQLGVLSCAFVKYFDEDGRQYLPVEITRYGGVSFYHLAARRRDIEICYYLRGCGVDPRKLDSDKRSMVEYAKIGSDSTPIDLSQLKKITQLMCVTVSPARSRNFPPTQYYLIKEGFDLVNNPATRCSVVHYCLTKFSYFRTVHRKSRKFKADPFIPSYNQALPSHYAHSGSDTGHLKNALSSTSSEGSMEDSFLLTNAVPQNPQLNRGYWRSRVEKMVYNLVQRNQCVEVFVGPVFTDKAEGKNGPHTVSYEVNGVSKPTHLFVVIYLHNFGKPTYYLSYLIPNEPIQTKNYPKLNPDQPPKAFLADLEHIQTLSGVGFINWRPNVPKYPF